MLKCHYTKQVFCIVFTLSGIETENTRGLYAMIEIKKMSKKAQKDFYNSKRGSWNGVNPVTKVVKNKKKYDRNRSKREAIQYEMQ